MPAVSQVGHGEELQREGQLEEAQHNLDGGHPRTGARCLLQPRREHGEQREGQGQRQCKAEHAQGRSHPVAAGGRLDEQQSHDGRRAGETHQRERECHEEDAEQTAGVGSLRVDGVGPAVGQFDFEPSEERQRKHHQQQEQEDIEHGTRRQRVQRVGTEEGGDEQSQCQIDHDDGYAVGDGVLDALLLIGLGAFQEERYRHRNDGPDAGHGHGEQSAHEAHEQDVPQRMVGDVVAHALGLQFLDDGAPEGSPSPTLPCREGVQSVWSNLS